MSNNVKTKAKSGAKKKSSPKSKSTSKSKKAPKKQEFNIEQLKNSSAYKFCDKYLIETGILYFVLAFMIPAVIMYIAFRKLDVHMFDITRNTDGSLEFGTQGNKQILVVDLWHQYYPFFRVVREKLLTGGSFLYSWENGMGTNFLSLISYYAASPLNWLTVFFSEDNTRDALTYLLIAKIGFASAFFSVFLRYTYNRKDFSIVVFGVLFALSSYMLGYYWNVMWFDTVALFPLVMTGIVAITREGKWKLYTIALALSLFSNYYIAFFTCIFTMFAFASGIVIYFKGFKDSFYKLWLIIRSSVIGIGLTAFMLLPAYLGLKLTYSANNVMPANISWYDKWTDIFANLISYDTPATKEGLPNFACGMLAVTLFGVFLFSFGIKIREKICAVLLLALIVVSCNMNKLNFIWHGFHATNQIPHRFAFIFSFVLVAAAFRAYDVMKHDGLKIYQLVLLIPGPAAVFFMNYLSAKDSADGFVITDPLKSSLIITIAYVFIFIAVKLFPFKEQEVKRALLNIGICIAVVSEVSSNAFIGTKKVGTSSYDSYPYYNTEIQQALDVMHNDTDDLFTRAEVNSTYTLNDSALYGYYGVSQFSSSANVSVTKLFRRLGLYSSEAGNRYYYRVSTPVVNNLLGINYILSKNSSLSDNLPYSENIDTNGGFSLLRLKRPMSLGFMMNKDILNLEARELANPFEYQNKLVKLATGFDTPVFTAQPVAATEYNNVDVIKESYGTYEFHRKEKDVASTVRYTFNGVEGSYLYGYAKDFGFDSATVQCDGITVDNSVNLDDYPIVFPMGAGQEGTQTVLDLSMDKEKLQGTYYVAAYAMNCENYEKVYERLADEQLNITKFSDTCIEGEIDALRNGVLYLAIPYENGWSIYVDGQKVETVKVLDAMLGAEVTEGHHTIKLKYSPDGFTKGLLISGGSLLLFIGFAVLESFLKKRKKNQPEEQDTADTEQPQTMDDVYDDPAAKALNADNAETETEAPETEETPVDLTKPVEQESTETEAPDETAAEDNDPTEENNEKSESNDGISGDEVSRVPETEQRDDDSGDTGESSLEGAE